MTTHTKHLTVAPWGSRTLHFHSWFAGRFGGTGNCVSPNASDIYIGGDHITQATLAHEWGHGECARKRTTFFYWLWVADHWLTQGYFHSKAEQEADEFMNAHQQDFPAEVKCDDDA